MRRPRQEPLTQVTDTHTHTRTQTHTHTHASITPRTLCCRSWFAVTGCHMSHDVVMFVCGCVCVSAEADAGHPPSISEFLTSIGKL